MSAYAGYTSGGQPRAYSSSSYQAASRPASRLLQPTSNGNSSRIYGLDKSRGSPLLVSPLGGAQLASNKSGIGRSYQASSPLEMQTADVQKGLPAPSANTSGLPMPSKLPGASSSNLPSTVSSALRSRQSGLPAPAALSKPSVRAGSSTPVGSYGLRRSQSQRPPSVYSQPITIKMSPRGRVPAFESEEDDDDNDDDEDDSTDPSGCVESLPPLKSTSYITQLASHSPIGGNRLTTSAGVSQSSTQNGSLEPFSEPLPRAPSSIASPTSKPSQLVKPIVNQAQQPQQQLQKCNKTTFGVRQASGLTRRSTTSSTLTTTSQISTGGSRIAAPTTTMGGQSNDELTRRPSGLVRKSALAPPSASLAKRQTPTAEVPKAPSRQPSSSSLRQTAIPSARCGLPLLGQRLERGPARTGDLKTSALKQPETCNSMRQVSAGARRYSLQQQVSGSNSIRCAQIQGQGQTTIASSRSDADQSVSSSACGQLANRNCDDVDDEQEVADYLNEDENSLGEDDDDATTATTMTQMSDSNGLADANRELNNMIKMLSSKEIMRESEERTRPPPVDEGERERREDTPPRHRYVSPSSVYRMRALEVAEEIDRKPSARGCAKKLPRVKSRRGGSSIVKSLSFNSGGTANSIGSRDDHNEEEEPSERLDYGSLPYEPTRHECACSSRSSNFGADRVRPRVRQSPLRQQQQQQQQQQRAAPRPRSRIIFDPTNNQFHLSQTCGGGGGGDNDDSPRMSKRYPRHESPPPLVLATRERRRLSSEDEGERVSSSSSSIGSEDDDNDQAGDSYADNRQDNRLMNQGASEPDDDDDEASRKLRRTQRKLSTTLKCLSSASSDSKAPAATSSKLDGHETDTIRRLKDCRGSLESLITITASASTHSSNNEEEKQMSAHVRGNNEESETRARRSPVQAFRSLFASAGGERGASSNKIVRHVSLRADPRTTQQVAVLAGRDRREMITKRDSLPLGERPPEQQQGAQKSISSSIGGDLLQRASKRFSASSSSITNKFRHMIAASSATTTSTQTTATNGDEPDKQDVGQKRTGAKPNVSGSMMTEQIRNKYNTLTPAEAKKLNRIFVNRQPLRTASVLRKPRAPPIVVTNLDNELERQLSQSIRCDTFNECNSLTRQASMRVGPTTTASDSRRHTVNYGPHQHQRQGALASRLSLYSTASTKSSSAAYQQQQLQFGQPQHQQQRQTYQISPHESFTNLSLGSCSRDAPDCASGGGGYDPTYRFQTMSVDLSNPSAQRTHQMTTSINHNRAYDTMRGRARYAPQRSNTLNYRFSDDSFASAKSDLSAKSSSVTPTKFNPILTSVSTRQQTPREPPRSASKASLSSSTYKVFHSPFANFKKLFRGIQKPFASSANQPQTSHVPTELQKARPAQLATPTRYQPQQQQRQQDQQPCGRSLNDFSLSDSTISHTQLSLNYSKSQSPPACPPPPPPLGELKSMSYLENSINYSNYDEFTRSRNERLLLTRPNAMTSADGGDDAVSAPKPPPPPPVNYPPIKQQLVVPESTLQMSQANGRKLNFNNQQLQQQQQTYDTVATDENENSNWQMTSLPVYYERNLTTVFEEAKQASYDMPAGASAAQFVSPAATMTAEEIYQSLKPPRSFEDPNSEQQHVASEPSEGCERASSVASSNSPALSSAGESVLEFHRQQPATPYRFSFAQPQPNPDQTSLGKSLGLPPRAPPLGTAAQLALTKNNNSEINRQDNNSSSSGNSSNYDEQLDELVIADFNRLRPYFLHLLKTIRLEGEEPSASSICRVSSK